MNMKWISVIHLFLIEMSSAYILIPYPDVIWLGCPSSDADNKTAMSHNEPKGAVIKDNFVQECHDEKDTLIYTDHGGTYIDGKLEL